MHMMVRVSVCIDQGGVQDAWSFGCAGKRCCSMQQQLLQCCMLSSSVFLFPSSSPHLPGDDWMAKANKKLQSFGFFGNKYEEAAEMLEKAANNYKLGKVRFALLLRCAALRCCGARAASLCAPCSGNALPPLRDFVNTRICTHMYPASRRNAYMRAHAAWMAIVSPRRQLATGSSIACPQQTTHNNTQHATTPNPNKQHPNNANRPGARPLTRTRSSPRRSSNSTRGTTPRRRTSRAPRRS